MTVKRWGPTQNALYRPDTRTLYVARWLHPGQRAFQLATQLALLTQADLISSILATDDQLSADARGVARIGLANYFAGALLLPYRIFLHGGRKRCVMTSTRWLAGSRSASRPSAIAFPPCNGPMPAGMPFIFVRTDSGRKHLEKTVRHRISLLPGGRQLPALGGASRVRLDRGEFLTQVAADARRALVLLDCAEPPSSTSEPIPGAAQELRDRTWLRSRARRQADLFRGDRPHLSPTPPWRSAQAARSATAPPARSGPSHIVGRAVHVDPHASSDLPYPPSALSASVTE